MSVVNGRRVLVTSAADLGDPTPRSWDVWRLNADNLTLVCGTWQRYYVDLERCTSSAEVLDWIIQISNKLWATPKLMVGLLHALDDVLNLQGTLCPGGRSRRLSRSRIHARVLVFTQRVQNAQFLVVDDDCDDDFDDDSCPH